MSWMAWTLPSAVFFVCIGMALMTMTVLEIVRPTRLERGFLPMPTTRGDRFFISLLSAAFIHLAGLAWVPDALWIASALSVLWAVLVLRWG